MNPSLPPLKPVTIQGIADALGVHKSTVSIALSGKGRISPSMRERILSFAGELGYEPDPLAQRLANRSKSRVACLCSGSLDPGRGAEKIALIQSALTNLGLEVPFDTPPKFSEGSSQGQIALFRQLRRARPQAIVCSVHTFHDEAFAELEQYQNEGGIVVSYDLPMPLACDQVVFDRVDNAYQGARYLLERGQMDETRKNHRPRRQARRSQRDVDNRRKRLRAYLDRFFPSPTLPTSGEGVKLEWARFHCYCA